MTFSVLRIPLLLIATCLLLRAAETPPAATPTPVAPPALPLRDGEKLKYRVSWAFAGAGAIDIEAHRDDAKEPRLVVTTSTATRGFVRLILTFDAKSESIFDLQSGRLLSLHEKATQGSKVTDHTVTFDYITRQANYMVPAKDPRLLAIPAGDPLDLIMGLLSTRSWNIKEGETRDALVLFKDDFYELTIHAARYEDLETPLGTFKTLVLEPRMDKTPPKGMFKKGSSVRVWISQDERRLPVRFEVEFGFGTGTATLESYTEPEPAKPAKPDEKDSRP